MSRFSAFGSGSEWLNGTIRLKGAFLMAIDNIRDWSYSFATPVWCVYECTGFHLGNIGLEKHLSREQFIGAWKLVSFELEASGEISHPWGEDVVGIHTWDETGHFAFQGGRAAREKFASDNPLVSAPEEASSALGSYMAYFGTYEVDENEGTVTHNGIGSLFPNWVGMPQKRFYDFSGHQLTLASEPVELGGKMLTARLLWERLTA